MRFRPCDFWDLMLCEAELILKGDKERQKLDLRIQTYSIINGIGCSFNKDFKFIDPYKEDDKKKPQKRSRDSLLDELEDLKKRFNK